MTFVGGTAPCKCGTVFELSPTAGGGYTYQLLYSFTEFADGGYPLSIILGANGNLYGTTQGGGGSNRFCSECGAVFELSPPAVQGGSWTETPLYDFSGNADGAIPEGLVLDGAGNLYGFALYGGEIGNVDCYGRGGCGTAFRLSANSDGSWTFSVIHTFQPSEGSEPRGAPILDADGNLFGAASAGGKQCTVAFGVFGCGTIFELISPKNETASGESNSSRWHISTLHAFSGIYDGAFPASPLAFDAVGNIYGATSGGGDTACGQSHGCGTVFELSPATDGGWLFTRLWAFPNQANGGDRPEAGVVLDGAGNLYGSTGYGGYHQNKQCATDGCGVIYELPSVAVTK